MGRKKKQQSGTPGDQQGQSSQGTSQPSSSQQQPPSQAPPQGPRGDQPKSKKGKKGAAQKRGDEQQQRVEEPQVKQPSQEQGAAHQQRRASQQRPPVAGVEQQVSTLPPGFPQQQPRYQQQQQPRFPQQPRLPQQQQPTPSQYQQPGFQQQQPGFQQQQPRFQQQQQPRLPQQQQPQPRLPQQQQPQPRLPQQQQPRVQQQQPASVQSVTSDIQKLGISKGRGDENLVAKSRITPGREGRIIKVESNHLQLNLGKLREAFHYDVAIDPDKPKKFMRPVIESFRRKYFPTRYPAFDGKKNLYTTSPLSNDLYATFADEISIKEQDGREKMFKVEIKFANRVDLSPLHKCLELAATPQEALQVVDIVLRSAPVLSCIPIGRSFFTKPAQIIDLGEGMEMYHGFYQSAIRGWKPLLNIDVAHKAFPKSINLIDTLLELCSSYRYQMRREDLKSLDSYQRETLNKYVKNLRVQYEIPGQPGSRKCYRVNELGEPPETAKFTHEGRPLTVVEYFRRFKNCPLRYPKLPTLWVGKRDPANKILLPLELCMVVEGQGVNRKMTETQTSAMIRHAATSTSVRKEKIMRGLQVANYNANPCVKEFGFSVGSEFQKLDARVLTPPALLYANSRSVRPSRGVWRNNNFLNGVTINKWTIASVCRFPPKPDHYKNMADLLRRAARDAGMNITTKPTEPFVNIGGRQRDIEEYFRGHKNQMFDVIFVVVPDSGREYSYVKKAAEIVVGCLTQCVKTSTIGRKMNPQTALNLLLKVNSKLNGVNHTLAQRPPILARPVMIMGADVTHPGPDAKNIPSVAAVTASHDPKAFQYNICWRLQPPTMEIIVELKDIVKEQLKFFFQKTGVKPEAILFFRDGVSEGQFEQVRDTEILAIRSACKELQAQGFEPKITFIVVQKRHHTRLFPMNSRDSEDKNINVPAGTCVDTEITHPYMQDFYLVSHASIQGVAKPTKYCTLWDDNNLNNDQVEQLAYYLCHMFTRCNRSVSYPAPTYYAHLAAARAKVYIENDNLNMDKLQDEFKKFQIKDEIRKGLPMFFV